MKRIRSVWLGVRVALLLALTATALTLLGTGPTRRLLALALGDGTPRPPDAGGLDRARRLAAYVEGVAARIPGRPRCLTRTLVLAAVLRRQGLPAEVRLGARRGATFEAHAWVEIAGAPLRATDPAGFTPFSPSPEL